MDAHSREEERQVPQIRGNFQSGFRRIYLNILWKLGEARAQTRKTIHAHAQSLSHVQEFYDPMDF